MGAMAKRETVLKVTDLMKKYGDHVIVDRFPLTVYSGEAVALTGRNGSGKSTVLRCIIGALHGRQTGLQPQVQIVHMGDGTPTQAAIGVIEDLHGLQGGEQVGLADGSAGFLAQLAHAGLPQAVALLQKTAGHGPQALTRRMAALNQ